ncbi:MAG: hypothetical protein L6413_05305 [Coriobacteriia bacterium]|nr:hypothetical protein [Coriobacteriia bacterium]
MTETNPQASTAREAARAGDGTFGPQPHTAPEAVLNPRIELDAANAQYQENTELLVQSVREYLLHGMPAEAERVQFEESDQGDYLCVVSAYTADGSVIDTEDEFDRWADVDEIVQLLGHPDDNRAMFSEIFQTNGRQSFTWERSAPTDPSREQVISERIDALVEARRELGAGSQAAAIIAVRRMMPEDSRLVLEWGDQSGPDYLTAHTLILADGTELDGEAALEAGIDWDELDMAASDIRNTQSSDIRGLDTRGLYFEIDQKGS